MRVFAVQSLHNLKDLSGDRIARSAQFVQSSVCLLDNVQYSPV